MNVIIQKAKNNEDTALIDNINIHSGYNPSKEAERFVENFNPLFSPEFILLLEPGLSYVLPYFKKKYPNAKIGTVRYISAFNKYNSDFDFIINYYDYENHDSFENFLFNFFGEEKLLLTQFVKWEPTAKIFSEIDSKIWISIKNCLEKAKTLLITRQYFEKKWFINSVNFFCNLNNTIDFSQKIDVPVFIVSSGPSLKDFISFIKEYQNKAFIICLSSAISCCLKNNIIPDLCLSTDGGYWAGQHLKSLYKFNVPVALASESYCQKKLLKTISIMPLKYNDGISNKLYSLLNIKSISAARNGTVSGTALELALSITPNDVYFFGLDLSNQKGFQHTQPNELEMNSSILYNKLYNSEKKSVQGEYSKGSLDIYKRWFQQYNPQGRNVFRVIDDNYKKNELGKICDIDSQTLITKFKSVNKIKNNNYFKNSSFNFNADIISNFLNSQENIDAIKKQLFPLDYIRYKHEQQKVILDEIDSKYEKMKLKILKTVIK